MLHRSCNFNLSRSSHYHFKCIESNIGSPLEMQSSSQPFLSSNLSLLLDSASSFWRTAIDLLMKAVNSGLSAEKKLYSLV